MGMPPQPLWRGSIQIVEATTGGYDVFTSDRHEHGGQGERNAYDDLCWEEVVDVIDAFVVTSGERRVSEHRRIIKDQWIQLSLYDLPGAHPPST